MVAALDGSLIHCEEGMDKLTNGRELARRLNLSRIFIEAFDRAVCTEMCLEDWEDHEMAEVVDRLRLSRPDDIEAGVEAGIREGQKWAKGRAKLGQLKTVASGRMKGLQELFEFLNASDAWDHDTYREALDDRDEAAFGKGFATGFVRGAAHVWAQVRREL